MSLMNHGVRAPIVKHNTELYWCTTHRVASCVPIPPSVEVLEAVGLRPCTWRWFSLLGDLEVRPIERSLCPLVLST